MQPQDVPGLYIHIPFCRKKCLYCDFASWPGMDHLMPAYVDQVVREIHLRGEQDGHPACDTVFFGGGTPSILPPQLFLKLFQALREAFVLLPGCEITCECNPGTLTPQTADVWAACGVNRISFGLQSASERLLQQLGRIHTAQDAVQAVEIARQRGIENINLDLMLGLPGQQMADVQSTLDFALALHPTHVSCYALIPEEGTPLMALLEQGALTLPEEETERAMYSLCRSRLAQAGLAQYEISNFALPGRACAHNVHCWERRDYWGFGCAAASLRRNTRWTNPSSLRAYLDGQAPERQDIPPAEAMFETMMLGLRLTRGVSEDAFAAQWGVPLWQVYGSRLAPALKDGRLERQHGYVRLTERGMDVMNTVLVALMD